MGDNIDATTDTIAKTRAVNTNNNLAHNLLLNNDTQIIDGSYYITKERTFLIVIVWENYHSASFRCATPASLKFPKTIKNGPVRRVAHRTARIGKDEGTRGWC